MLHTSVLLSVAVLSVASFVPPNYYNYAVSEPGAPKGPGGQGEQGPLDNYSRGIKISNSSGYVISKTADGNVRITKGDGTIVITVGVLI